MEKKEVWSTSGIIANRNNWSLAADVELLKHLQALSEKIFTKASSTLHSLNSFENDVNQTCISIANTSNKFKSLSDTQFIESKVQEESADISEPSYSQTEQPPADRENENITVKLKEALENGFRVLDTQYDLIPVSGSDSEDDEPEEILLRARNPYLSRRLPHIIGSEEFTRNDNLGLIDSSSSEEEEEEEEEEDDDTDDDRDEERKKVRVDSDEESITVQKPPPLKTEFIRPRTEIIRISSSDSEDSEESIPCDRKQAEIISESKNKLSEKSKDDEPEKNPNSFAEHLSAALNSRNISSIDPPDFEGSFSPPPFPGKDNSISSEDESDDSSDIFATKKNTKQSVSNINYKPNHENESDVDNDWDTNKIGVLSKEPDALRKPLESSRKSSIVSKTSQYSTSSNSSSMGNEVQKKNLSVTGDQFDSQPMPKSKISESNINSINKRMVSAINSELSAKLNLKNSTAESKERLSSTKISSESSENRIPDVSSNKSSKNNTPAKTTSPKATYEQNTSSASKRSSQKPALFNQLDGKSSSEEDNEDDLFRTVKKAKSKKEKSKGLFDDNGNIENLFSPLKSTSKSTTKTNDSFSSKPNEPTKSDKIASDSDSKPPVVDLFKKSDLFASDSDSEDDIFSIIKNKKKPANDIFSTKIESDSNDFKRTPISSNDTQSTKTSTISPTAKSAPAESKSQSLLTENKSANDFNSSVKSAESAKKNVNEKKDVINVTSSENRLFDDVKTAGDLFQSDDYDDLFSKTIESADNRTSVRENANMSKSEVQSSTVSFADTVENSNVVKEKSASEISSNIHRSSASESTNRTENLSTSNMENTAQSDKKGNIFAKIQPSKYSSSSEDEMENSKNENSATNLFGAPLRNKSEESNTDETSKKGTKSNDETVPTRKEDLFEENDNASGFNIDFKTKADDNFGESYESRSAMFLPPKDDFLEGFSEDEDIKDNNYLSQDDDDLFSEKFEPPPFQQPIPDDDIFGEKYSTKSPPESQKNIVIDATPAEDLFAKSSSALSSTDLFHENDIFGEKRSTKSPPESRKNDVIDASPDEDLFSKSSTALSSTDLFQGSDTFSEPNDILEKDPKLPDNQARSENKEIEKNDTDQKLLQNNEENKQ